MNILKNYISLSDSPNLEEFLKYLKGIMFTSYLRKTLHETRKNYFIKENKNKVTVNYEMIKDIPYTFEINEINFEIDEIIENMILYKFLKGLTEKQKYILYKYYIIKESEREISEKLGTSQQAVNKIRKRAIVSAKKFCKREEG